jgi:elongation factor Ts
VAEISANDVKALRDKTGAGMMDCKRALADAAGDLAKAGELLRERGLAKAVKRQGRETHEGTIGIALAGSAGALVELRCETDFVAKTPVFQELAGQLAALASRDAGIAGAPALLQAKLGAERVEERIQATVGRLGENVVLARVARLGVDGEGRVGGYVHAGGKLGVLVALRTALADGVDAIAKDLAMHVAAADPTPVAVDRDGVPGDLLERERALYRRQAQQEGKPPNVIERIVEGRIAKFYKETCLLEQPFVKDPERSVRQVLDEAAKRLGGPLVVGGFVRFKLGEGTDA